MSGAKIDVDALHENKKFEKAKIVVDDFDINSLIDENNNNNGPTTDPKSPRGSYSSGGSSSKNLVVQESNIDEELSIEENIIPPQQNSTAKEIAEVIRSEIKSQRIQTSSVKYSSNVRQPPSTSNIKPPRTTNPHHVNTPPTSETTVKEEEQKVTDDDFSMMPETDSEKHVFWKTKLQTLKMTYKDVTIPHNIHEIHWREVRKIYYIQLDRVSIDKNVDSYELVMIVMFFICEYLSSKIFKVDSTGFAVHSIRSRHRYRRLLIELGENDYSSFGANWPVELRLGCMVLVNLIIFIIAKKLFKYTGSDMSEEFFQLYQNLGNETVDPEVPSSVGMDTPSPNEGGGGNMMGILGNILGAFGGGGGGNGGGLGNIFSAFTGGGQATGTRSAPPTTGPAGDSATSGTEIPAPTYRRKKKKKKPASE